MQKRKIRLLVVSPIPHDACSSWRCMGPLTAMSDDLDIVLGNEKTTWVEINAADLVFMHRPFGNHHVAFMAQCKQFGKKLWVDYDDDLLNVMDDNPTFNNYGRQEIKDAVRKCLQLADIVTVTTEDLKDLYQPYAADIRLIPNAWDSRFMTARDKLIPSYSVWWRGSDSHQRDLMTHSMAIVNSYQENKHTHKFHFIGYRPWFMLQHMPEAVFHYGRDFKGFYDYMGDHSPDVVHVPLHDAVFNKSKSMIAGMEGTLSGAVILGPNWKEWQVPGFLHYDGQADFKDKLNQLIALPFEEKQKRRNEALGWFRDNRSLTDMNKLRAQIIEELLK